MTEKQMMERIKELEAMVAMANPPSPDCWPAPVCILWRDDQKKIQRKLDGIAKRMNRKVFKSKEES